MPFAEELADLAVLGNVGDDLKGDVNQRFVELGEAAEIVEDLRQQCPVVPTGHRGSAVAVGVATQGAGSLVEFEPLVAGVGEALAGFGGVETIFDGRQDLEPEVPGLRCATGEPSIATRRTPRRSPPRTERPCQPHASGASGVRDGGPPPAVPPPAEPWPGGAPTCRADHGGCPGSRPSRPHRRPPAVLDGPGRSGRWRPESGWHRRGPGRSATSGRSLR